MFQSKAGNSRGKVPGYVATWIGFVSPRYPILKGVHSTAPAQKYDFVEMFAGQAWVSRCMKARGFSVAALDINFGCPRPGKQNAMDLLSDAGFASLTWTKGFPFFLEPYMKMNNIIEWMCWGDLAFVVVIIQEWLVQNPPKWKVPDGSSSKNHLTSLQIKACAGHHSELQNGQFPLRTSDGV